MVCDLLTSNVVPNSIKDKAAHSRSCILKLGSTILSYCNLCTLCFRYFRHVSEMHGKRYNRWPHLHCTCPGKLSHTSISFWIYYS